MGNRIAPIALVLALAAPAAPALAELDKVPAGEAELLEMYFSEEALVTAPTRHPKPVARVAENVAVVTAEEIRAMNAHSLSEVLERVTGVFVSFVGRDFLGGSLPKIQGSDERHVLVLVDEVPWNFLSGGNAETATIPVEIIDRIEVIKGPASSTWGSALGGVVNVITREAGGAPVPSGTLYGSYGEHRTWDARAALAGGAGGLGYYLYGGHQHSGGLHDGRGVENPSAYGKVEYAFPSRLRVGVTGGYAAPDYDEWHAPGDFLFVDEELRTAFVTAYADAPLGPHLSAHASAYGFAQRFVARTEEDGRFSFQDPETGETVFPAAPGDLFRRIAYDEETRGANARLVWERGGHAVVLGGEYAHGDLDQTTATGAAYGFVSHRGEPELERGAVYLNDTATWGAWSVTPGLRYDDISDVDPFVSPSLGVTWRAGAATVLRGAVARGFTAPSLAMVEGGGLFLEPNPDVEAEEVWSYQAGVETGALRWVWLKATAFRHELTDAIEYQPAESGNLTPVNRGWTWRTGAEGVVETAPLHGFSLRAGVTYVRVDASGQGRDRDLWDADLVLRYQGEGGWVDLAGHYVDWDLPATEGAEDAGSYDDTIWDLTAGLRVFSGAGVRGDLFAKAHNLLNGRQHTGAPHDNPDRWVEGGVRLRF